MSDFQCPECRQNLSELPNQLCAECHQFQLDDASDEPREDCLRCGGEGFLELVDCHELWGEDCLSEKNRLVECPECGGSG